MSRFSCALLLAAVALSISCINVPEVEPAPNSDGGTQPTTKFTLSLNPNEETVLQGGRRLIRVAILRAEGFTDSVSVTLEQPPFGITASPATIASGESTTTLTVDVSFSAAEGEAALTIRAASGNDFRTAALNLTVVQTGDLIVRWAEPASGEVVTYTNGLLRIEAVLEGGSAEAVEFRRDSQLLARVATPPYTYTWDTRSIPEGQFQVTARAILGSRFFTSTVRTILVDRTPPVITNRTPASSDSQVSARVSLEAMFSEPILPTSISRENVEVLAHGNTRVETAIGLSADGMTLTISPNAPIPTPSTVLVKLGNSTQPIQDLAGNTLQSTSEWIFTVPVWLPIGGALSAIPGATPAENAVLKLDATDLPVVAWSEFDGSSKNIHVARWNGASWVHLGGGLSGLAGAGTHADNPDLQIDDAGRIILAWDEVTGTENYRRLFLRRWSEGNWENLPSIPHQDGIETDASTPKLAQMPDGTLILYFVRPGSALHGLKLERDASEWTSAGVLFPRDHFYPAQPALAVHGANVFVSYNAFIDPAERRGISVLKNHQAWLGDSLIPSLPDHGASSSALALTSDGYPIVAWQTTSPNAQANELYVTRWDGTTWLPTRPVTNVSRSNASPSLTIGTDHRAVIAWSGVINTERVICVAHSQMDTWEMPLPPLSANGDTNTPSDRPSLALDTMNRPFVAWQEGAGQTSDIYIYQHNR